MSGFYSSSGAINVTVVTAGTATHGVYAADGSINVALSPGASNKLGAYEPSGGWYVTYTTTPVNTRRAPDGSLYVATSVQGMAQIVSVVSGSLSGGGGGSTNANNWFFLLGV
jgi:hypothetical protein